MRSLFFMIAMICVLALVGCSIGPNVKSNGLDTPAYESNKDFRYVVNGNNVTIIGYKGLSSNIVIPDKIDGKDVVSIEFQHFPIVANYFAASLILKQIDITIAVNPSNNYFKVVDGVLFSKDGTVLVWYPSSKKNFSYAIPNGVTHIAAMAFLDRCSLTSVSIPASVTNIGNNAFNGCNSLTDITVRDSNDFFKVIDGVLFTKDETTLVRCPSGIDNYYTYAISDGVTHIASGAFSGCRSLIGITIPDSVTSIGDFAFSGCRLGEIILPASITNIGIRAFECNLTNITISPSNNHFKVVDGVLFTKDGTKMIRYPAGIERDPETITVQNGEVSIVYNYFTYTIPDGVTHIASGAFSGCQSLNSVIIPDSVTSIEDFAFSGCTILKNVTIPNSVKSIGESAFADCTVLTNITLPESLTSIGELAFFRCTGLTGVTLPNHVTTIGDFAFFNCRELKSITLSGNLTNIGDGVFVGCNKLTDITVATSNRHYKVIEGALYTKDGSRLICGPAGAKSATYTFPSSLTSISDYAFYGWNITSMTIPDRVTNVNGWTFFGCILGTITVHDSNNYFKVVDGVLLTKDGTTLVRHPSAIIPSVFIIPDSVTSIGELAFNNCTVVPTQQSTGITIPSSVISIKDWAFLNCNQLKVTIPSSVTEISSVAFLGCYQLTITCYRNSYTHKYCVDNNISFVLAD